MVITLSSDALCAERVPGEDAAEETVHPTLYALGRSHPAFESIRQGGQAPLGFARLFGFGGKIRCGTCS
ncbi:MAG: hypothetical protein ACOX7N_09980 [Lawsonibacter sp.]